MICSSCEYFNGFKYIVKNCCKTSFVNLCDECFELQIEQLLLWCSQCKCIFTTCCDKYKLTHICYHCYISNILKNYIDNDAFENIFIEYLIIK